MSDLLRALSQDPIALAETFAVFLSGCYVLKLLLQEEQEDRQPVVVMPASSKATSVQRSQMHALRAQLLKLFAVGEMIAVPKRSLRYQGWLR